MRRKLCLLSVALSVLLCFSLVVSVDAASMWSKTYGGADSEWACSLIATADGGYAIAGTWNYLSTYIFNQFTGGDFWLVKTDALGNIQWNRTYGGAGNDVTCSVVATSDGGYAIAGTWNCTGYYGLGYYGEDWLVKTDALGNMLWNQTYGETGENMGEYAEYANSLVATSDGGYALAGTVNNWGISWLMKTDVSGNLQWNRTYDDAAYDTASSSIVTSGGGYTIASFTAQHIWLAKTDALGNIQWNQTITGETGHASSNMIVGSLVTTSDGGYALAAGSEDFWLVKTDSIGVVPEFSSWLIPSLLLVVTTFIIIRKKRLFCTPS